MTVQSVDRLILKSCQQHQDKVAFQSKQNGRWQPTSYRELGDLIVQFATGLRESGFATGEHAAIIASPSLRWVVAYLAILHCGGVVVPVDKDLKATELRHILSDADATLLVTEVPYLEILQGLLDGLPLLQRLVLLDESPDLVEPSAQLAAELKDAWQRLTTEMKLPRERTRSIESLANRLFKQLTSRSGRKSGDPALELLGPVERPLSGWIRKGKLQSFEQLLSTADHPAPARTDSEQPAVILYTSGTTGQSKGAILSHDNLLFNIAAGVKHLELQEGISTLSFLPINHVFEQVCGILLPLSIGGTINFAESLKKLGENLAEIKPTFLLGVPAVYRLLLERIMNNIRAKSLTRLLFNWSLTRPLVQRKIRQRVGQHTTFVSGGAALDPSVAAGFHNLGLMLFQGYGITETSPIIAAESPHMLRPGSVGRPLPGVEVRITDAEDDGVGEILVRGPNVMLGYYKNPRATDAAIIDGWYHTGDLGHIDTDGYLFITGRAKNLIVTANGKNVYPEEVENELLKSSFIAEIMVYGHKAGASIEEVHAIVFPDQEALDRLHPDKLSQSDVEKLIRDEILTYGKNLADYKRVRKFTLREDEFPKTTTRKIKRFIVEADIHAEE